MSDVPDETVLDPYQQECYWHLCRSSLFSGTKCKRSLDRCNKQKKKRKEGGNRREEERKDGRQALLEYQTYKQALLFSKYTHHFHLANTNKGICKTLFNAMDLQTLYFMVSKMY